MKKYSVDSIRNIISDVKCSGNLMVSNDRFCTSAEELISEVSECKKYVLPEKREEWCDLFRAIFYDAKPVIPPIIGETAIALRNRANYSHDNKIISEILNYIYVAEIMEVYDNKGLDEAIRTFNSYDLTEWARDSIIYDLLRFSIFGPEFIESVSPELLKKPRFANKYNRALEYLKERNNLEARLAFALEVKATLEDYKNYCANYYYWECDNTEEKLADRKERIARIGDEYLLTIVNNTYIFAKYILKKMKEENKYYENTIFTSVYYEESDCISLNCTGGHFADELYYVECDGIKIWISEYVIKSILADLRVEQDYETEEVIEGDIGAMYTYPKLNFDLSTEKFNQHYSEFFENRKRNITL